MEKRFDIKDINSETVFRKGAVKDFSFLSDKIDAGKKHSLFFTCEDNKFYRWKHESSNDKLYMLIDDSLDSDNAEINTYCLNLSVKSPKMYVKRAVHKIYWDSYGIVSGGTENWETGIYAKTQNLIIHENGFLRFRFEKWINKENVVSGITENPPDETVIIDIPAGTYDYANFSKRVKIHKENTACVVLTVEGFNYEGEVYFERPFLTSENGINILPDFDLNVTESENFLWCGENLSKREWPEFEISLNGNIFFDNETFLRMHRFSPVEIPIPDGLIKKGENILTIKYKSDYNVTLPVTIKELSILEYEKESFSVVYAPDFLEAGKCVNVLIETFEENVHLDFESEDFSCESSLCFENDDLYVIKLKPLKEGNNLKFTLKYNDLLKTVTVGRTVYLKEEKIICGSGDMIYINNSDFDEVKRYLKWFIKNEIGRLLTVRPVYHWGGGRVFNPKVWDLVKRICNDMDMWVVLMSDGRDLPGIHLNPARKDLEYKGFLGRQVHERDGQLFYWSPNPKDTHPITDAFYALTDRKFREDKDRTEGNYHSSNIMRLDGKMSFKRLRPDRLDMEEAKNIAMDRLGYFANNDFLRHTGPAVMFKYFYEAGFDWVGAETMDGSFEPLLAFLRGASKTYGKDKIGVHHALQWSTHPHDTEQRFNRFSLANYVSYINGVTDLNTEEGFWFMENKLSYHNRLSYACEKHREKQKDFNNYIQTHSRTGKQYANTAFVHGRLDGWNGFIGSYVWGIPGMNIGDAENSWKLLKIFYPLSTVEKRGMLTMQYVPEDHSTPCGWFSGTPRGQIDAIPMENGRFDDYKLLVFAGYNKATGNDFDRIYNYAETGGRVVLTWAHLSDTTFKPDIDNKNFNIISHTITEKLAKEKPLFEKDFVNGNEIKVCVNLPDDIEIIEKTDKGQALIYSVNAGKGKIYLLNALTYPGDEAVFHYYENLVKTLNDRILETENNRIICGNDVEYATYIQENGQMHFYCLAVDWYNETKSKRKMSLKINNDIYDIELNFGEILKIVADKDFATWTESKSSEILYVDDKKAIVQGCDKDSLFVAKNGKIKKYKLNFENNSKIEITL